MGIDWVRSLPQPFGSGSLALRGCNAMAPADAIGIAVKVWTADDHLVRRATTGVIAVVGKEGVSRAEVCANYKTLLPLVKHIGFPEAFSE